MGYQQNLMIFLGIIIISISIAVGITMYIQDMTKINRQSIISDMNIFAGLANTFYRTPANMGGGDGIWDVDKMGMWFGYNYNAANNIISNDNGTYVFSANGDILTIVGIGTAVGNDGSENVQATLQLTGQNSEIVTTINN